MMFKTISRLAFPLLILLVTTGCANTPIKQTEPVDGNNFAYIDALIKVKKYREAEIILTRSDQEKPNNFDIQERLFVVNYSQARENISKALLQAGSDLDSAETALTSLKLISLNPALPVPQNYAQTIDGREQELASIKAVLTNAINTKCNILLSEANSLAKDAKGLLKIDREKIVLGLVKIRECNEHGKWMDVAVRGRSNNSLRELLNLVEESERATLLRSAGFGSE